MATHGRRIKRLGYRDWSGRSIEAHTAHWIDFEWEGGPYRVQSLGPWGEVQVWASSPEEGKRVIRHAASIAGWDPDEPGVGEWYVVRAKGERFQTVRRYRVQDLKYGVAVTKRPGPNGYPEHASLI